MSMWLLFCAFVGVLSSQEDATCVPNSNNNNNDKNAADTTCQEREWLQYKGTFFMTISLRMGNVLAERGWTRVDDPRGCDILLGQSAYDFDWPEIEKRNGKQVVNRAWGENVLGSKGSMQHVIKLRFPLLAAQILPRTFRMYDKEECEAFYIEKPRGAWIEKPTHEARGRGIVVFASFDNVVEKRGGKSTCPWTLNQVYDHDDMFEATHESGTLMQKYIENPLLITGKKSEIRIYFALLSTDPWIVAVYPEGTVRLCSEPYDANNLDNPLKHITNTYQQKKISTRYRRRFRRLSQDHFCFSPTHPPTDVSSACEHRELFA